MNKKELAVKHHGREVSVTYYTPENMESYPVVILSHGYNGHQTDFALTCEYFANSGIACAALTFCGGSNRDISGYPTTQMSLFTEREDLMEVFDYIKSDDKVRKDQMFLFGGSQGGLVSALAAAELKDKVKGLILLYPAFMIPDNWGNKFKAIDEIPEELEFWEFTLGKKYFIDMINLNVYDVIGNYEGPVLILQGTEDEIATTDTAEKGMKCYKNCKMELFVGEPHGFSDDGTRRMEAMMMYFIHEVIGR